LGKQVILNARTYSLAPPPSRIVGFEEKGMPGVENRRRLATSPEQIFRSVRAFSSRTQLKNKMCPNMLPSRVCTHSKSAQHFSGELK